MEIPQNTLSRLADLMERMEELHHRLNKLQLSVEVYLRRN